MPGSLNSLIGFLLYPSVDLSTAFHPKYNTGISFAYLKDDSSSTTVVALIMELDDMTNLAAST
ncbi:hypothetical protein [Mucilaginibacter polytrichastri]|uniref:Uncharacterized protein n=1 Tax=Mucilaginibacter polytrichastri TaxID=1302689 RepID=A0A1Q5ZY95_9SPHI|nr:hypothetical protein [Mucilaginibacter polytrichastri]OKS86721.1 hypothetical protein RG47T_2178 [Mucilaginibacter polytrichastri]